MIGKKQLVPFALATFAAAAAMSPALGAVRPDDRAGPLGAPAPSVNARTTPDPSDVFTRAVARHGSTALAPVAITTSSEAGFHWLDAGLGAVAGVVACLALLLVGGRALRVSRSATAH